MKTLPFFSTILLLGATTLLLAKVNTDYDHAADWSRYHSFSWIKVQAEDPLWNDRISAAVNSELAAKGWQMVPSGGDASVSAYGSTHNQKTLQTWYDGFGGGWGWRRGWIGGGPDLATTTVENTAVGTLMVDIFDTQTKKLIWRGSSSDTLSGKPEKNEEKLRKSVADMFKNFPPKSRD
jgi:hypothetical protein